MKYKPKPLSEHSEAEVLTLIAWGHVRIRVLKEQQEMIRADIRTWREEMRRRKGRPRRTIKTGPQLKSRIPEERIREAVKAVVNRRK